MKFIRSLVLLSLAFSCLFVGKNVFSAYEIAANHLGYKMILASSTQLYQDQTYIGFLQFENITPPFVLIVTKGYNIINPEILSEIVDGRLEGKIMFPPGLVHTDIKELRINGYTILWESKE